jgi:hypothetical protein
MAAGRRDTAVHRSAAALLAVALLAGAAAPAVAHGTELTGTVTDETGATVEGTIVLAHPAEADHVEDALASEDPPAALADLAADPPFSVRVARTNASGGYVLHLPSVGRWDVVAVAGDDVSALHTETYTAVRETRDLTVTRSASSNGTDGPTATPTPDRVVTVDLDDGGRRPADERGLLPVGVGVFVAGVAVAAFAAGRTGVPYLED